MMRSTNQVLSAAGTAVELLEMRARDTPDAIAVGTATDALTFARLLDDSQWLAMRLSARGVGPGTRCALILPSGLDFVRAVFAVQMTGAAPVAIDATLARETQLRRASLVDPAVILTAIEWEDGASPDAAALSLASLAQVSADAASGLRRPAADDVAYLQFTSGSTGEPRPAMLTHRSLLAGLSSIHDAHDIGQRDVMASATPLHLSPGLVRSVFGPVAFGCPAFIAPASATGLSWLSLLTAVKATVTSAPDFAYRTSARLVASDRVDLRSLRIATSGGEAVRADSIAAFERRFGLTRVVQPAYGLTEATLIVASAMPGAAVFAESDGAVSCGHVLGGLEVRVVDSNGLPCRSGEPGEMLVRGAAVFAGYFGDAESTAHVLRGGWLHTGDIAARLEDGQLVPRARSRALIKRAGEGIAPREIEERLDRLEHVRTSAVVAVSRATAPGEQVVLVLEAESRPASGWRHLAMAAQHSVADLVGTNAAVVIVEAGTIPRSGAGKVHYAEMQKLLLSGSLQADALFTS